MFQSLRNCRAPALAALLILAAAWVEPALAAGNVINAPNMGRGSAWTVYAFGNAQAVSDAFRAIFNFTSSSLFQNIASMLAVIGILGVGLTGGFNSAQGKRLMGYIVGVFLLAYVMFGATNNGPLVVRVEVIDTVDNTWKAPVTVPAVVGIPAALISTAGHEMTKQIEASFPLPDEMKMSNGAPFNLAASMIADASRAKITDPHLASSLAYYVQDCFTMGVASGALSAQTLLNSTDFLNDIRFNHDSVMVNTVLKEPVGSPAVVTCKDSWALIKAKVDSFTDAASMLSNASAWSRTPALSVVNAAADSTAQWATNNGITNGASMVKQAAMLSAFKGAYSQTAAATGNSDFLTGLALNQAHETQVNGWITSGEVFNRMMGYLFAILQVFVYCVTPMVLAAALIPGLGVALLKNFGQILLWMALWTPMLAIVNFIVLSMQQSDLGGALSTGGSMGYTLTNMGIISEKTANMRAAATLFGTMVPVLTWYLVKGGMDFSRVLAAGMGENMAAQAASTLTTGNYSLNQASMDSFTANKNSIASSGAWGSGFSSSDYSTGRKLDGGGSSLLAAGGQQATMTVGTNIGTNQGGTAGHSTAVADQGGTSVNASDSRGVARSGGVNESAQSSESSVGGTMTSGVLSAGAGLGIRPTGGKGDSVPGTGGTVPMGGAGGGMLPSGSGDQAATLGGSKPSRTNPSADLRANLQTGASGQHMNSDLHSKGGSTSTTGNDSRSGTRVDNGGHTASSTRNASESTGYQSGTTQSIQMGATLFDRAQLLRSQMQMSSFATGGWGGSYTPPTPTTDIEKQAAQLMTPNAVPDAVTAVKGGVDGRLGDQDDETRRLKGNAERKSDTFRAEGDAARAAGAAFVNDNKGAAGAGSFNRAVKAGTAAVTDAAAVGAEKAQEGRDRIKAWAEESLNRDKQVTTQQEQLHTPQAQQTKADLVAAQRRAMTVAETPEEMQRAAFGVPPRGATPRHTAPAAPESNQGAESPSAASPKAAATASATPAVAAPAAASPIASNPAAPTSAAGQPVQGQPGANGGQAGQGTQTAKGPEDQDREKQVVAAAATMPAVPMTPPQVPQPEPVTQGQQPVQVAMATPAPAAEPQPQPGLVPPVAAPNPFSGQTEQTAGATQAQVQMAEQRAERMGNQMREADNLLVAADTRPEGEHLSIIHQAREITGSRNA